MGRIIIEFVEKIDSEELEKHYDGKGGFMGAVVFYTRRNKVAKELAWQMIQSNWDRLRVTVECAGIGRKTYTEWEAEMKRKKLI